MLNKNILFISYDGLTDPLGQSQVIPYLAGLTRYGYHFTILSCDKPNIYKSNKRYVLNMLEPYPIKWVSIPYHKYPLVVSSIYDFYQLKRKAGKLHKLQKFNMVHSRPGLPALVALWMKKKFKIKFLNDVRGFWADERVDGGMWDLKNPFFKMIYKYFKKHEFSCKKNSDYNTCLTYSAQKEMHSWSDILGTSINAEVIPCSVDLGLFDPENIDIDLKNKLKQELGINENDIIVSYLGSVGGWYLTDEIMQFCKILSDKIATVKFLFITPGRHEIILDAAAKYELASDKIIIKYGQRHEIPALLSFSSYSLFFIKSCYSKISSSPTKHGETMAMGIPVITNSGVGDVKEIVTKYNAGIVLENLDIPEFTKAADLLKANIKFCKAEIRKGAEDFYSLEKAVLKYLKVYKIILGD